MSSLQKMPKIIVYGKTVPDRQRSLSLNRHYWLHFSYGVSRVDRVTLI
jgi:hypothetical protein